MHNKSRILLSTSVLCASALVFGNSPSYAFEFLPGDLVISTVSGTTLNNASPITLKQLSLSNNGTTATAAGSLVLPQTTVGANWAISGEYGSSSEGFLQRSANGQ
ncbi:hypothetical protein U6W94_12210, partial [Cutibacterium acnes]